MEQPVSGRAIMMAEEQKRRSESDSDPQWSAALMSGIFGYGTAALMFNMMPNRDAMMKLHTIDAEFTVVDVKRVDHE